MESGNCPRIRNMTLPTGRFVMVLEREVINGTLAMYNGNENLRRALETCEENVVAPIEVLGDEREDEVVDVAKVLRRGFVMNWIASDCDDCRESGGRCGFNDTSWHFRCFCPDRPHLRSCKPGDGERVMPQNRLEEVPHGTSSTVSVAECKNSNIEVLDDPDSCLITESGKIDVSLDENLTPPMKHSLFMEAHYHDWIKLREAIFAYRTRV